MQVSSQITSNKYALNKNDVKQNTNKKNLKTKTNKLPKRPLSTLKLDKRSNFNSVSPVENASPLINSNLQNQIGIFERKNLKSGFGINLTNKPNNFNNIPKQNITNKKNETTEIQLRTPVVFKPSIKIPVNNCSLDQQKTFCPNKNDILKKIELMTVKTGLTIFDNSGKMRSVVLTPNEKKITHLKGTKYFFV